MLTNHSSLAEHLESVWRDAASRISASSFRRPTWREPYQLLVASLVYLQNAFTEYPGRLHARLRTPRQRWLDTPFSMARPALFNKIPRHARQFSAMHLASISYRLPLAVFLLHKSLRRRVSPFRGLDEAKTNNQRKRRDDWIRDLVYDGRLAFASEPCRHCRTRTRDQDEDLRVSLAIVMAHRDGMVHGEFPSAKRWRSRRKAYGELRRCRLIEAQLALIEWSLQSLDRGRRPRGRS